MGSDRGKRPCAQKGRRRRIEMEGFCFLVSIANEHDLRAGNGEDGVQITVMTDNYQEYYEQCSRWRASVFFFFSGYESESESVGTILRLVDMFARGYASML
jgi:hypothetical protein